MFYASLFFEGQFWPFSELAFYLPWVTSSHSMVFLVSVFVTVFSAQFATTPHVVRKNSPSVATVSNSCRRFQVQQPLKDSASIRISCIILKYYTKILAFYNFPLHIPARSIKGQYRRLRQELLFLKPRRAFIILKSK